MEEIEKQKFIVLQDKPLEKGELDSFGHGEIANSVVEVIRQAPRPFNIGIYGQWGVGKSTICKIIEERLSEEENYRVVYFDTWKYERDSFRRQFLITLDQDLKLGFNYKEVLNQSLSIPFDLSWFDNIKLVLGGFLFRSLSLIIFALIIIIVFRQTIIPLYIYADYTEIAKKITDLGIISILLTFIFDTIKQFQGTKTIDKTDSAEGFEEYFAKVLKEIHSKDLLIIIDNLDRLSSEKAVSLLSDIKTFLSDEKYCFEGGKVKNRTVFVIPCDNKAINNQLLKEYGEEFDTEEYLRKFFNHSIQIPKFLNLELDDFIVNKLNTTEIEEFKDNYDLVFILSFAFRNNPREIIQFINSLISLYLLAKERKIDRITEFDHIAFLAKVLVLRVKWPRLYEKVEDHVLRTGDNLLEIITRFITSEDADTKIKIDEFINSTSHIDDDEYKDIYFSLRQSEQQKTIPEWNSFIISLLESRVVDAEKIYEAVKNANKLNELAKLLAEYCRRNKKNENALFNIFVSIHKFIKSDDVKYFQNVLLLILKSVNSSKLSSTIENLDFSEIFSKGLEGVSSSNKGNFSDTLILVINNIAGTDGIDREKYKNTRKLFEIVGSDENKNNFTGKSNIISDAKRNLIDHVKFQELFLNAEKTGLFRKDILTDILDILTSLGPTNNKHYAVGLTLFSNLLQWPPIIEDDAIRFYVLEKSLEFLNKSNPPALDDGTIGVILNTFTTRISTWYSQNKSSKEKALCVKILQKINLVININKEPETLIRRFVSETANTSDDVLQTLGNDFIANNPNIRNGLIERSRVNSDLLTKTSLGDKLTDAEKADILAHIVGYDRQAISFFEFIDYKLPKVRDTDTSFLKNIVLRMINSDSFSDTDLFKKWLDSIKRLGIEPDQVEPFIQKMRQVRIISDEHKKVIADFVLKNSKDFGDIVVKEFTE